MSNRTNVDIKNKSIYVYCSLMQRCTACPLPRSSSEKYLISLAWKLHLRGNIAVCKQIIQPTAANKTLKKA